VAKHLFALQHVVFKIVTCDVTLVTSVGRSGGMGVALEHARRLRVGFCRQL
jgi:hypothetical protein